jgi:hypothetical protein
LPDLPLFAVLPHAALPGSAWFVLAVLPVTAGCVLAVLARRGLPGVSSSARVFHVAGASVVCGGLIATATYLSGGTSGGAEVGRIGPAAHWTGLLAVAEVGAVALGVTTLVELFGRFLRPGSAGGHGSSRASASDGAEEVVVAASPVAGEPAGLGFQTSGIHQTSETSDVSDMSPMTS